MKCNNFFCNSYVPDGVDNCGWIFNDEDGFFIKDCPQRKAFNRFRLRTSHDSTNWPLGEATVEEHFRIIKKELQS